MRYALIIPDGAADQPHPAFGGSTALQTAHLPHMDRLAAEGQSGHVHTVPPGMAPGSDVANMSIFGYDPARDYTGRAPLEAASMGLTLRPGQAVFRANTVTIEDGILRDYSAGHIPTAESEELVRFLDANLSLAGVHLHPGKSYRPLCVIGHGMAKDIPERTPPHDLIGQPVAGHDPVSQTDTHLRILDIERRTRELLRDHPLNTRRRENGQPPVTQLWLWGGGVMPSLIPFRERFGVEGALISAVDLLQGIGRLAGLEILSVPGITGYYDTDYAAKGRAAVESLRTRPFVAVHIEAPDEAGHAGDAQEKIRALERIDADIVAPLIREAEASGDLRLLCLPDHPTPIALRTHTADPVPFALWGHGIPTGGGGTFSEAGVGDAPILSSRDLLERLFG